MPWVQKERTALVATLRAADPDGETLCVGWNVRRLLAHLIVRERRPLAGVADLVSREPPGQEKRLSTLTDTARSADGYQALVDQFAEGPPRWSPMSWAGESLNLVEYVIHHEDIRRAGGEPAEPRVLPEAERQAVWKRLGLFARQSFSRSPVGVRLARPGAESQQVKKGPTPVTISADPVDLALYLSGRRGAALVEISGPDEAVQKFQDWVRTT